VASLQAPAIAAAALVEIRHAVLQIAFPHVEFDVALIRRAFTLIRAVLAPICDAVTVVGNPVTVVGNLVALVGCARPLVRLLIHCASAPDTTTRPGARGG